MNNNYRALTSAEAVEKKIEVSNGFLKHAGINDATLRNVTVGDNCLIEKVGNFINNYTIGDDCYISNICTMETVEGATYGEGHMVSVLNEMGDGNVILFNELTPSSKTIAKSAVPRD